MFSLTFWRRPIFLFRRFLHRRGGNSRPDSSVARPIVDANDESFSPSETWTIRRFVFGLLHLQWSPAFNCRRRRRRKRNVTGTLFLSFFLSFFLPLPSFSCFVLDEEANIKIPSLFLFLSFHSLKRGHVRQCKGKKNSGTAQRDYPAHRLMRK